MCTNINDLSDKLIECQTCFRTFHTQAQFGQHSRICRGGSSRKFINISSQPYKYCFLERQNKDKLEIKTRFIVKLCNISINWKDIAKKNGLHDSAITQLLKSKQLNNVHVAIRHRKESGLIVANFVIRNVEQTPDCIHSAKIRIEEAVDEVKNKLPEQVHMEMHLCQVHKCRELVIRDTEGYCSRHRAQKYHKKNSKKQKNKNNNSHNNINNMNHMNHMNHMNQIQQHRLHQLIQQQQQQLQQQQLQQQQQLLQQQQQINNFNLRKRRLETDYFRMEQPPKQKLKLSQLPLSLPLPMSLPLPLSIPNDQENEEKEEAEAPPPSLPQQMMAPDPLSQQISFSPILFNQLREFFGHNSYMLNTPSSLYGVPINQSPLRSKGMNIISVDYSTSVPNPKQVLQKNGQLVVFGTKKDTQQYLDTIGESQNLVSSSASNSIRFPEFCHELTQNYMACVLIPEFFCGSTLAQTPQLAQSGINAIAVNLQIEHPNKMCNTPFKPNDLLLCCFDSCDNKQAQLLNVFEQIKKIKNTRTEK